MATVINSHKVENFDKWKTGFDAGAAMREQVGIKILGVYQSSDNENEVTVISEMASPELARAVLNSPEMKAAIEKSGAVSVPEIKILKQVI